MVNVDSLTDVSGYQQTHTLSVLAERRMPRLACPAVPLSENQTPSLYPYFSLPPRPSAARFSAINRT